MGPYGSSLQALCVYAWATRSPSSKPKTARTCRMSSSVSCACVFSSAVLLFQRHFGTLGLLSLSLLVTFLRGNPLWRVLWFECLVGISHEAVQALCSLLATQQIRIVEKQGNSCTSNSSCMCTCTFDGEEMSSHRVCCACVHAHEVRLSSILARSQVMTAD